MALRTSSFGSVEHWYQQNKTSISIKAISGEVVKYKSTNTVIGEEQAVNYLINIINPLEPSGITPHIVTLRVSSLLMLIRNLRSPKLCNKIRLVVKKLSLNSIEEKIINSIYEGVDVLIQRIPMISSD